MTRASQRAAEDQIERFEAMLKSGVNEQGEQLTRAEREGIELYIANVYYDLEEI